MTHCSDVKNMFLNIGKNVLLILEDKELSVNDLSVMTGIAVSDLTGFLNKAEDVLTIGQMCHMVETLEVDVKDLLEPVGDLEEEAKRRKELRRIYFIHSMETTIRLRNALIASGMTRDEFIRATASDFLKIEGVGPKSLKEALWLQKNSYVFK